MHVAACSCGHVCPSLASHTRQTAAVPGLQSDLQSSLLMSDASVTRVVRSRLGVATLTRDLCNRHHPLQVHALPRFDGTPSQGMLRCTDTCLPRRINRLEARRWCMSLSKRYFSLDGSIAIEARRHLCSTHGIRCITASISYRRMTWMNRPLLCVRNVWALHACTWQPPAPHNAPCCCTSRSGARPVSGANALQRFDTMARIDARVNADTKLQGPRVCCKAPACACAWDPWPDRRRHVKRGRPAFKLTSTGPAPMPTPPHGLPPPCASSMLGWSDMYTYLPILPD